MIDLNTLALRFEHHTGASPKKSQQAVERYVLACAQNITRNYLLRDVPPHFYAIGLDELRRELGDILVRGQRFYLLNVFQSFKERIFDPVVVGSNITQKITMATLNYSYEDILLATGKPEELVKELYARYRDKIDQDEYDLVPIDMNSLAAYIRANQTNEARSYDPEDPNYNAKLIQELDRNLKSAELIYRVAECLDGTLTQVISESEFGRKYYTGPNLQTVPKIVRHAALGHCYEYDLESNVFAWKYSVFKKIAQQYDLSARFPATLEYLDHKSAIRRRLARDIFDTEADWAQQPIKKAITAIGFGAPARTTGYRNPRGRYEPTALNAHITSVEKLQKFLDDSWVKEFIAEQKTLNEVIFEVARPYNELEWRTIPGLVDAANRLKKNSVISYLYQNDERAVMESIWQTIEPYDPVLMVHDCIYTKKPVPLRDLREQLIVRSEYYRISKEEHQAFAFDEELLAHRARIKEEERLAQGYTSKFSENVAIEIDIAPRPMLGPVYNSDSGCVDGTGYLGQGYENYNPRDDYALNDDPDLEEYQRSRDRIMAADQLPQWVKERIGK